MKQLREPVVFADLRSGDNPAPTAADAAATIVPLDRSIDASPVMASHRATPPQPAKSCQSSILSRGTRGSTIVVGPVPPIVW
jgi:hypothetical protein